MHILHRSTYLLNQLKSTKFEQLYAVAEDLGLVFSVSYI